MTRFKTIKEYAQHLLLLTDFVDAYGRRIGFDYQTILAKIKTEFPRARTTVRALRYTLYQIDKDARLPARHRSRRILSREYAKSLLLRRDSQGSGFSFRTIKIMTSRKFPNTPPITTGTLKSWSETLTRERIKLPPERRP